MPQQVVIKDADFLKMIVRGYTSAYSIYISMKKEAEAEKGKSITYKNIGERMLRLARDGLIEESEIDKRSIHGRRDYRLTSEGIRALMPNTEVINEDDVTSLMEYLSKAYSNDDDDDDQSAFAEVVVGQYLLGGLFNMLSLCEAYSEHISTPELMPLKRALKKDLASFRPKETLKLPRSEPVMRPITELIVINSNSRPRK
jgi:hypothetical protein